MPSSPPTASSRPFGLKAMAEIAVPETFTGVEIRVQAFVSHSDTAKPSVLDPVVTATSAATGSAATITPPSRAGILWRS